MRIFGAAKFRPHPGIARRQHFGCDPRPIGGDAGREHGRDVWRHRIIDSGRIFCFKPFHIGTKTGRTAHIQCEVHAKAARFRHRIDQMPERAFDIEGGVIALGQDCRRHMGRLESLDPGRQPGRPQSGAVDQK